MKKEEIRKMLTLFGLLLFLIAACNKDNEEEKPSGISTPCPETPTVTDLDGNVYNTVLIGNQCWMKEILKTGTMINSEDEMEDNNVIEKYCYDNNPINCETYGGLYQWNEIMQYKTTEGIQGICPSGWHIPTHDDWMELLNYSDCSDQSGAKKLRSCRQVNSPFGGNCSTSDHPRWDNSNQNGIDSHGFSGLPSGARWRGDGRFDGLGDLATWWSSTEYTSEIAWHLQMQNGYDGLSMNNHHEKQNAHSVRCIKD